jgi:hypothetical protein
VRPVRTTGRLRIMRVVEIIIGLIVLLFALLVLRRGG